MTAQQGWPMFFPIRLLDARKLHLLWNLSYFCLLKSTPLWVNQLSTNHSTEPSLQTFPHFTTVLCNTTAQRSWCNLQHPASKWLFFFFEVTWEQGAVLPLNQVKAVFSTMSSLRVFSLLLGHKTLENLTMSRTAHSCQWRRQLSFLSRVS